MQPPPPLPLLDELIEEVLLHISPGDPVRLVRAALVCKRWRGLVADPRFRRRFCEFHRTPPVLGVLRNAGSLRGFLPTSSFRVRPPDRDLRTVDTRHGRVLLLHGGHWGHNPVKDLTFAVWDPITDEHRELPSLPMLPLPQFLRSWNAAVLCAGGSACDHLDCRRGAFRVVVVGTDGFGVYAWTFLSEAGAWRGPTSVHVPSHLSYDVNLGPSALVGNALYFGLWYANGILEYNFRTRKMCHVPLPRDCFCERIVLITTEEGGLGLATVQNSTLCLWSKDIGPSGLARWAQSRVIDLEALLPVGSFSDSPYVVGSADGTGVIFVQIDDGLFSIDLKSLRLTNVCFNICLSYIFPYMSFCFPALGAASIGERPGASAWQT